MMILMKGFYLHPKGNGKPLGGFIRGEDYSLERGLCLQYVKVIMCMPEPAYYYFFTLSYSILVHGHTLSRMPTFNIKKYF